MKFMTPALIAALAMGGMGVNGFGVVFNQRSNSMSSFSSILEVETLEQRSQLSSTTWKIQSNSSSRQNQRQYDTSLSAEATKITMPALSSTMKEGRVVSWLKSEGEAVEAGEAIMVVESDKADMDVEAFEDGFLAKILIGEGESAPVGEVVALLATEEDEIELVAAMESAAEETATVEETSGDGAVSTDSAVAAPDCSFSQVDMPALSSTMKEGKVVSWLKAEGDPISAGEAIMVVESDKADMDVEAFEDGYLAAIITEEGETGTVGAPVAIIAEEEKDIPTLQAYAATLSGGVAPTAPPAAAATPSAPKATSAAPKQATSNVAATGDRVVASPLAKKKAADLGIDISTIAGTGPGGRITASDIEHAASGGGTSPKKTQDTAKSSWTPAPGVVAATPMARVAAKKAKLDLASIPGTGKFGRVTEFDVKVATGQAKPLFESSKSSSTTSAVELPEGLVPFTGMQRAVSNNMEATLSTPVFRVSREIQMDAFDALYQQVKPKGVSVSALLAKIVALAIEKYPIINSSYTPEGTVFNKDINIAMAVAINGGLITPTVKYANERSITDIGENWRVLVQKAKEGTLTPDEYNSGTFTISNLGMFGVTQFDAILPQGMGGILAIGGTQEVIVPCNQAIMGMKKVKKMTVTLTCDHRQIYGADGALFLKEMANIMENGLDRVTA
eukprot:CAMPEP_0184863324 /NCGR_PEP_ID=MMETSP0580-20130426/10512_1 /TAXON_ID=1118495 /ORGANISM="Dactyliosolen fragilissimus" /LENGTH=676 /DNA_ID=CAMNT_0027361593 /DNA_START=165 /DNA_END=2195 /DNA_ORIENTATION=-